MSESLTRLFPILSIMLILVIPGAYAYVNISSCGIYDTPYTEYRISQTLSGIIAPELPTCLLFNTSNITIDCQGNEINGTGTVDSIGVLIGDPNELMGGPASVTETNITFKNCRIHDYSNYVSVSGALTPMGLFAYKTANLTLQNITFYNNNQSIVVQIADNLTIVNNTAHDNEDTGIAVIQANNSVISGNILYNNLNGILYYGGSNITIFNNTASGNRGVGIVFMNVLSLVVANNTVYGNADSGIGGSTVQSSLIENNTVYLNNNTGIVLSSISSSNITWNNVSSHNNTLYGFASGISLSSASSNLIAYNILYNNSGQGIEIASGSSSNLVYFNNISRCMNGNGIHISDSNYNIVSDNNVSQCTNPWNYAYGISLLNSNYTLVENNTLLSNSGEGIHLQNSLMNNLTNNTIVGSSSNGIMIDYNSTYNRILLNNITSNGGSAIVVMNGSAHNVISYNYIDSNGGWAVIQVQPSFTITPNDYPTPNITITNNTILNSGDNGINLIYSNESIVSGNILSGSTSIFGLGIMLDNSSLCLIDNNTISYFPGIAILLQGTSSFNNISNSLFESASYGSIWSFAIQFSNTDSAFPEANSFHNITIYNSSRYVAFSNDFSGHLKENFTNFTLCNDSLRQSCILFDFAQIDNAVLGYQGGGTDNLFIGSDFISVDSSSYGATQFDVPANITLPAPGCSNPNDFKIYRSPVALPLSRSDVLSTGIEYTPGYAACISSNALQFNVSSFSGYALESIYGGKFNETVSSPGVTLLTRDYEQGTSETAAIGIITDNVILDLGGHTIENGTTGIYIWPGLKNVTIMNGTLRNLTVGLVLNSTNDSIVQNVIFESNSIGAYVDPSYNNTFINNTFFNNSVYGLLLDNSHNNTLINNTFYNNTYGLYLNYSTNNTITNNTAYSNSQNGFHLYSSSNNTLTNNSAYNNSQYGFLLDSGSNNTLTNNTAYNNSYSGFYLNSSSNNTLTTNFAYNNSYGFYFYSGNNNTLTNNTAYNNTYSGILLNSTTANNITASTVYNNTYGIYLLSSSENSFTNISAFENYNYGIYLQLSDANNFTDTLLYGNALHDIYIQQSNNDIIARTSINNAPTSAVAVHNSGGLNFTDMLIQNSLLGFAINDSTSTYINGLNSTGNNMSIYAVDADGLFINGSWFEQHNAYTSDNVFDPVAIIRFVNSTTLSINSSVFASNNISAVLLWNASSVNITFSHVVWSNSSKFAFDDTGHIMLYPYTSGVQISYLNCSDGGLEYGGACIHTFGGVKDLNVTYSNFENMTGGLLGRVSGAKYGGYFGAGTGVSNFNVSYNRFNNLGAAFDIHASESFATGNNVTNCLYGTNIRPFPHLSMSGNNYTEIVFAFSVWEDLPSDNFTELHNSLEHNIAPSNTVDGKPIYYYSGWAGTDKHDYVETNMDGAYYVCIDCSNVVFENLTNLSNIAQVVMAGFSTNITVRNSTGETMQGVKFLASNDSRVYNCTFKSVPNSSEYFGILPPDIFLSMHAMNIQLSNNINISDVVIDDDYGLAFLYRAHNNTIQNITHKNSYKTGAITLFESGNNTFADITFRNLSGLYPYRLFDEIPETVITAYSSYDNRFDRINISESNLTSRGYYVSVNGSSIVNDSWFNHTHISFEDYNAFIANTTTPSAPLPQGTQLPLASPPLFLEIQNTSEDSWLNLTFYYTDDMVPPGRNELEFRIWKYSSGAGEWQRNGFITRQEVDTTANTITAYNITNFSSPFGPLLEELPCVNLSDNSTWEGRITNVSGQNWTQFIVNMPIKLCTDTYNAPAFQNASGAGILFYLPSSTGVDCNGSTLIGNGNGTFAFISSYGSGYNENISISNCSLSNYVRAIEVQYGARNITIENNVIANLSNGQLYSLVGDPRGIIFGESSTPLYNNYTDIKIVNNNIENLTSDSLSYKVIGIGFGEGFSNTLNFSSNILIANNTMRNFTVTVPHPTASAYGILLAGSYNLINLQNVEIINNTISLSDGGILIKGATNSILSNNNLTDLADGGISLQQLFNSTIMQSNIRNTSYGVYLTNSSYNNFSYNRIYDASSSGIWLATDSISNRFENDTVQESRNFDLRVEEGKYSVCTTFVNNMTGSGGRPILFINSSVNISNANYSELILCGAQGANVTNVTIRGSDTLQNNGMVVLFSNNTQLVNINTSGNNMGLEMVDTYGAYLQNITYEHNLYGGTLWRSSNNTIDHETAYNNSMGIYFYGNSEWNNVTNLQLYDLPASSVYGQLMFGAEDVTGETPENNLLYNISIYNSRGYIIGGGIMTNSNNLTNLTLCNREGVGCIQWSFVNITNASLVNGTNIVLDDNFVSLNDSEINARPFNKSANITILVDSCEIGSGIGLLKAPGFPKTKADIEASGSEYVPLSSSCISPTLYRAEVDSFSGYTESPPYNISVLIDGIQTSEFNNSGEPYNLTVGVRYANGSAVPDCEVRLVEDNGYLPFALPQYTDSNVSNYVYAKARTRSNGNISLTVVPTGAAEVLSENVGEYNVTVRAYNGNVHKGTAVFTVAHRNLPYASNVHISVPNRGNVGYFNDDVYRVYSRVKEWLQLGVSGGGEKYNIVVYTNGTVINNTRPLTSGKPYGLNITVLDAGTLTPVPDALVQVVEQNGLPPLALPQCTDTNVSNIGVGYTYTKSSGSALITFIPTGNPNLGESALPEQYNVSLRVYVSNSLVADVPLNVTSRSLSYTPSGSVDAVYNQGNIASFNDKVYVIYSRILAWLQN